MFNTPKLCIRDAGSFCNIWKRRYQILLEIEGFKEKEPKITFKILGKVYRFRELPK